MVCVHPGQVEIFVVQVSYPSGNGDEVIVCTDGTILKGPEEPETLIFEVNGQETTFLIVDGEVISGVSGGIYTLTVSIE